MTKQVRYVNRKGKSKKIKPFKPKLKTRICFKKSCKKKFKTRYGERYCPACRKKYFYRGD